MRSTYSWIRGGILLALAFALLTPAWSLPAEAEAPSRSASDLISIDGTLFGGWLAGLDSLVQVIFGAEERGADIDPDHQPQSTSEGGITTASDGDFPVPVVDRPLRSVDPFEPSR